MCCVMSYVMRGVCVGVWVKAVYHAGRLQAGTKLWTCCGGERQLSLQCNSWEDRERRQAQVREGRRERGGGEERMKGGERASRQAGGVMWGARLRDDGVFVGL